MIKKKYEGDTQHTQAAAGNLPDVSVTRAKEIIFLF